MNHSLPTGLEGGLSALGGVDLDLERAPVLEPAPVLRAPEPPGGGIAPRAAAAPEGGLQVLRDKVLLVQVQQHVPAAREGRQVAPGAPGCDLRCHDR